MNIWEMIVLVVAIGAVASVLRARIGGRTDANGDALPTVHVDVEGHAAELRRLRDRVAVLERILTDNNRGLELDREIERLRDRP